MIENLKLPEELLNTPFKDWEHPSLRFDIKEDDEITKHIFFCKTDKQKSFSENTEPKTRLLEALEVIQKLPKMIFVIQITYMDVISYIAKSLEAISKILKTLNLILILDQLDYQE